MEDKYQWLENILDDVSLKWVRSRNENSIKILKSQKEFGEIVAKFEKILGNKDKIPFIGRIQDGYVYNFWEDEEHVQGLWRRTTVQNYHSESLSWETLIDFDDLSKRDAQKWVYHGSEFSPNKKRAMIYLSPGGSDANYIKEFDLESKSFVENGFSLDLSKGGVSWLNDDELIVGRIFGKDSMTSAEYPRTLRRWKRGESLTDAQIVFQINETDNSVMSENFDSFGKNEIVFIRHINFYQSEIFLFDGSSTKKLDLPKRISFEHFQNDFVYLLISEDWREFKSGDCIIYYYNTDQAELIYRPDAKSSIDTISPSKNGLYIVLDRNVVSSLWYHSKINNQWEAKKIALPENGSINHLVSDEDGVDFFASFSSFNKPLTYFSGSNCDLGLKTKSMPSFFKHDEIEVTQHFVTSPDGTSVPYFLVHKKDIVFDGKNPTILYGYGGFEISMKPNFSNLIGSAWLELGGVYVLSNIRGGGEYGPSWHQSALKEKRDRAYEDFFAIAEDLFKKKITSPDHLGAHGGSNGGLLMGVCYTQRPELFKAINCGVPLLDMKRYHKLLAGYSWIAEYGNPDDEIDGKYIRNLSPYHRIEKNKKYPTIFLNTSTKDDRVHPGHARKFAAQLEEYNHEFLYHENIEGGHAGASNIKEIAFIKALDYAFFWRYLK